MRLTLSIKQSFLSNVHKAISIVKCRFQQKIKRKSKPKGDDDPAGIIEIILIVIAAEFIFFDKPGLFNCYGHYVGCRSPPLFLHFSDLKILKWRTSSWRNMRKNIPY